MTDRIDADGLKFFGVVSASISHELKNRFAIVNEQAGLLGDWVLMAENGRAIDPERLKRLAESLQKQVALGDRLLRHMNRFSHSVDQPRGPVDIAEMLSCITALAARSADRRSVGIDACLPDPAPTVSTSAFRLMQFMWQLLDVAMGPGRRTLGITVEAVAEGAAIVIESSESSNSKALADAADADIAKALGAGITLDAECRTIRVILPK